VISLIEAAQENHSGQNDNQNEQAVRDGNLVTANGTAHLEFAKEVLSALDAYPADYIENYYKFFKLRFLEVMKHTSK